VAIRNIAVQVPEVPDLILHEHRKAFLLGESVLEPQCWSTNDWTCGHGGPSREIKEWLAIS
jgi:hypothetical protein